jgi:hypothetical protein
LLFGFRDDIDLNQRWWHRLFKVLFLLAIGAVGVMLTMVSLEMSPNTGNIEALKTLPDFTKERASADTNAAPEFVNLPGELGQILEDGGVYYIGREQVEQMQCSRENAEWKDVPVAQTREAPDDFIPDSRPIPDHVDAPAEGGLCVVPASAHMLSDIKSSDVIVKFGFRTSAKLYEASKALGITAALAFVAMNFYYRGLVYIICGPQRKPQAT